jgi:hypothetical protein
LAPTKKYRYLRYVGSVGSYTNVAEIEFYSRENDLYNKLFGNIIGTEDYRSDKCTKEAAFDGNIMTYFATALDSGGWVGLDLGKPQKIDRICYLSRNDDNGIRPGDVYELFYWDAGKWNSLGRKTADDFVLKYDNCPVGALFLLRNHTRGVEERIFTYENDKQVWW